MQAIPYCHSHDSRKIAGSYPTYLVQCCESQVGLGMECPPMVEGEASEPGEVVLQM
jgi:hypothetical protein